MEWQILPRMAALSEIQWTEPSHKNFDSFLKRLPALLAIYRDRGYDFRQDIYDVNIDIVPAPDEGKARIAFQTFDDAEIQTLLKERSVRALAEIRRILDEDTPDETCFEKIERVIKVYEAIGADGGARHDF